MLHWQLLLNVSREASLGAFWGFLGASWDLLRTSWSFWEVVGPSWAGLGTYRTRLGAVLGRLGAVCLPKGVPESKIRGADFRRARISVAQRRVGRRML